MAVASKRLGNPAWVLEACAECGGSREGAENLPRYGRIRPSSGPKLLCPACWHAWRADLTGDPRPAWVQRVTRNLALEPGGTAKVQFFFGLIAGSISLVFAIAFGSPWLGGPREIIPLVMRLAGLGTVGLLGVLDVGDGLMAAVVVGTASMLLAGWNLALDAFHYPYHL